MNWREKYKDKIVTAAEAVKSIKSNDRVVIAHGCGEALTLTRAMVDRASELENVEVVHMLVLGEGAYTRPGMEKSFHHNALFVGVNTRKAVEEGRADFTPTHFSDVPRLFKSGDLPVDVALIHLSLPDENGICSFGISADYTVAAAQCARTVIAQINHQMPRTGGASISLDDVTWIVEVDEPLLELPSIEIGPVERAIGDHISKLVPDGATLQIGLGGIPDAVLSSLKDKKDLGIHTEIFGDGVVDLVKAGVITNRKKTINKGKIIATSIFGTRKVYDFAHNNPDIVMCTVDYTNDPYIIRQHENMVSINSALQVDLMGQVNAEMIGSLQYSGVGGQVDFVRGASMAPNGKSIIALPSTARGGSISRIVCRLDEGAAVTTSRNDVHYVVTEYGAVNLRGKSIRERAMALISIAHPDFREKLEEEARSLKLL